MRRRPARPSIGRPERLETRRPLAVDVVQALPDVTTEAGSAPPLVDLLPVFDLAGVTGTVVRLATNVGGDVFAELFDQPGEDRARTTPATVTNFLAYVDAGRYTNSIMHRSVPGFVVQGGGFAVTPSGSPLIEAIPQFPNLVNEPGNTNVRGTLAMAKLGNDPNSATNQFFFNLADNSGNLDAQNGGFTAFGRVLGSGMTVVDAMAALPRQNFGSPFDELPVIDLADPQALARENLVTVTSVSRARELVYTASSSDTGVAGVSVTPQGRLQISGVPGVAGTATITVRATNVVDPADFAEDSFTVTLAAQRPVLVAGSDIGARSQPRVTVVDAATGAVRASFLAFEPGFRGGVRPALGDLDNNGVDEILVAPGPGRQGEIRVFRLDGTELVAYRTLPFGAAYRGGIETAVGNVLGSAGVEIVAAASRGPGLVHVFAVTPTATDPVANAPVRTLRALPVGAVSGVTVTTADVGTFPATGPATAVADGRREVVLGTGAGLLPEVIVFDVSGTPRVVRRIGFSPAMQGGLAVAAGRYDSDALDDVIAAGGRGAGSAIEVRSGQESAGVLIRRTAFATLPTANLATYATGLDIDGDGRIDSLAASQGNGPGAGIRKLDGAAASSVFTSLSGALRIAATRLRAAG